MLSLSCRSPLSLFFSQTSPVLLSVIVPLPLSVKLRGAPARTVPSSGTATAPAMPSFLFAVYAVVCPVAGNDEMPSTARTRGAEALSYGYRRPSLKLTPHAMLVLLAHVVDDQ